MRHRSAEEHVADGWDVGRGFVQARQGIETESPGAICCKGKRWRRRERELRRHGRRRRLLQYWRKRGWWWFLIQKWRRRRWGLRLLFCFYLLEFRLRCWNR